MTKTQTLDVLNSLRGVYSCLVFIFHVSGGNTIVSISDPFREPIIKMGYLSVDCFFFLSGFVMTHVYEKKFNAAFELKATEEEKRENGLQNNFLRTFLSFFWNRLVRLYPLIFFSLTIIVVFIRFGEVGWEIMYEYLMISNWVSGFTWWNGPLWSLEVEFILYLLFPIFLWINQKINHGKIIWISIISSLIFPFILLAASLINYAVEGSFPSEFFLFYELYVFGKIFRGVEAFYAGICLYQVYELKKETKEIFDYLSLGTLILNMTIVIYVPYIYLYMYGWYLFTFFLVKSNSFMKYIFEMKILLFLGEISFSLYLLHFPLNIYLNDYIDEKYSIKFNVKTKFFIFLGLFSFLVIYSYLIYKYYELPTREYLRTIWLTIDKKCFEKKLLTESLRKDG